MSHLNTAYRYTPARVYPKPRILRGNVLALHLQQDLRRFNAPILSAFREAMAQDLSNPEVEIPNLNLAVDPRDVIALCRVWTKWRGPSSVALLQLKLLGIPHRMQSGGLIRLPNGPGQLDLMPDWQPAAATPAQHTTLVHCVLRTLTLYKLPCISHRQPWTRHRVQQCEQQEQIQWMQQKCSGMSSFDQQSECHLVAARTRWMPSDSISNLALGARKWADQRGYEFGKTPRSWQHWEQVWVEQCEQRGHLLMIDFGRASASHG